MHARSSIYEGLVRHRRTTPVVHEFTYSLGWLCLDLAELDRLFEGRWLWSATRMAPLRIRRSDYLGDPAVPLADAVRRIVQERTGARPEGRILLLTQPRCFGFGFNPVSFYFCLDENDTEVRAVIAEVNNTPWGEKHSYVLSGKGIRPDAPGRFCVGKEFHVSPFMTMDMTYQFTLTWPGKRLAVGIRSYRKGRCVFDASMTLRRREWNARALARLLIRFPFQAQRVVAGIYWNALKLWWKGVPFHAHPGREKAVAGRKMA